MKIFKKTISTLIIASSALSLASLADSLASLTVTDKIAGTLYLSRAE